jgi:hypothetical protein
MSHRFDPHDDSLRIDGDPGAMERLEHLPGCHWSWDGAACRCLPETALAPSTEQLLERCFQWLDGNECADDPYTDLAVWRRQHLQIRKGNIMSKPVFVVSGKTISEGASVGTRYEAFRESKVVLTPVSTDAEGVEQAGVGDLELVFHGDTGALAEEYVIGDRYTIARMVAPASKASPKDQRLELEPEAAIAP